MLEKSNEQLKLKFGNVAWLKAATKDTGNVVLFL